MRQTSISGRPGWRFLLLTLCGLPLPGVAEPLELSRQLVLADPVTARPASGWRDLPTLRLGSQGPAVVVLEALIGQSDVLPTSGIRPLPRRNPGFFDGELEAIIKTLQQRLGLHPDGIAGPQLYINLDTSPSTKRAAVEAFALRLEHLAHQVRQEGRRKMVVINVPSFTLRAIDLDSGKTVVESSVVVGRKDRQTPIGRLDIVSLTLNPLWKPPPVVMTRDILPRLGKDPKWWDKHALLGVGPDGTHKPGRDVTQEDVATGWKFIQPAGKDNALGLLKFETDSKDNIYLHDTAERSRFVHPNRTHSSGCVRVQKWLELAAFLADSPAEQIARKLERKDTRGERIPGKVPVFIEYSLGDVIDGKALYFPDIYNRLPEPASVAEKLPAKTTSRPLPQASGMAM